MSKKGLSYKKLLSKFDNDIKFKFEFYFNEFSKTERILILTLIKKDGDKYLLFPFKKNRYYIKNYKGIFVLDNDLNRYVLKKQICDLIAVIFKDKNFEIVTL